MHPFLKGSPKEKHLGANSFLLEKTLFQKELYMQENEQEVTVVSLVKMVKNLLSVLQALYQLTCIFRMVFSA